MTSRQDSLDPVLLLIQGRELNQLIMMMRNSYPSPQAPNPNASPAAAYVPYGTGIDTANAASPTTDLRTAISEVATRRYRGVLVSIGRCFINHEDEERHGAIKEMVHFSFL